MRSFAVYSCVSQSMNTDKETLIFERIEVALASLGKVDKYVIDASDGVGGHTLASPAGYNLIKTEDPVIALGKAAHIILADYQKRTLIAGAFDVDGPGDDGTAQDIRRLVWSCINTLKVVALGKDAWRSIQLAPVAYRRFHAIPPLRIAAPLDPEACDGVLVINHDPDERRARRLVSFLKPHSLSIVCVGLCDQRLSSSDSASWSGACFFHVHVGHHTAMAEELRIIDTWYSRRLAIQFVPSEESHDILGDALLIQNEVNGFSCVNLEDVLPIFSKISLDPILKRRMLDAGSFTAEPLGHHWVTIAEELIA